MRHEDPQSLKVLLENVTYLGALREILDENTVSISNCKDHLRGFEFWVIPPSTSSSTAQMSEMIPNSAFL